MPKLTKTVRTLTPGDKFILGKPKVEVLSNTPRDYRISVLELRFQKTGHTERRTFLSHFETELHK